MDSRSSGAPMLLHAFLASYTKNGLLDKLYHIIPLMVIAAMETELYGVIDLMYDVLTSIVSKIN